MVSGPRQAQYCRGEFVQAALVGAKRLVQRGVHISVLVMLAFYCRQTP